MLRVVSRYFARKAGDAVTGVEAAKRKIILKGKKESNLLSALTGDQAAKRKGGRKEKVDGGEVAEGDAESEAAAAGATRAVRGRPKKTQSASPTNGGSALPPSSPGPKWIIPSDPGLDRSLKVITEEEGVTSTTLRKKKPTSAAPLDLSSKSAIAVLTNLGLTDIFHLDLFGRANITKEIIIATGSSNPQLVAACDQILSLVPRTTKKKGILLALGPDRELAVRPREEGRGHNNGWIVVDCVTFMVHLFTREQREFYDLEGLYYLESRVGEGEDGWDWAVEKLPKHKVYCSTGFVEGRLKRGIIREEEDSESDIEDRRGKKKKRRGIGRRARKAEDDRDDDPDDDEVSMPKPKVNKKKV